MSSLRVFFVGGTIAYRGLFNWIRPAMYIPTMLGSPLFQLIFFTKLGQFARAQDTAFYVVGNGVQVCAMSSIYGMTMAIANERNFRTLAPLLASPANRAAVFLGAACRCWRTASSSRCSASRSGSPFSASARRRTRHGCRREAVQRLRRRSRRRSSSRR